MKASEELVLLAAAIGVGALAVLAVKSYNKPPTALPPSPVTPFQNTSGGNGIALTVSPTLQTQTVSLDVQDPVLIYLPTGGQWNSMDGAPVADKTSPIAFTFLGPVNHTIVWFDSLNQQHVTSYFFVLNPGAPTTNA